MELFLVVVVLVGFAFVALGVNIFFTKKGTFPETEVGQNRHMRELGITCTKCEENRKWREAKNKAKTIIIPKEMGIDFSQF